MEVVFAVLSFIDKRQTGRHVILTTKPTKDDPTNDLVMWMEMRRLMTNKGLCLGIFCLSSGD